MSKTKEVFRKAKVLFLCAFVATQIFIPQATVEAATCKHTYQSVLVGHVVKGHSYHTFVSKYEGEKGCNITIYLNDYVHKCTKCGSIGGAYSKEVKSHGNPYCPDRK